MYPAWYYLSKPLTYWSARLLQWMSPDPRSTHPRFRSQSRACPWPTPTGPLIIHDHDTQPDEQIPKRKPCKCTVSTLSKVQRVLLCTSAPEHAHLEACTLRSPREATCAPIQAYYEAICGSHTPTIDQTTVCPLRKPARPIVPDRAALPSARVHAPCSCTVIRHVPGMFMHGAFKREVLFRQGNPVH